MKSTWKGKRVLVMGLGLHGGGVSVARFFAKHGAHVTITDLRPRSVLQPSLAKLKGLPISFVLGRHRTEDFKKADLVIQNPGVPNDSPFLKIARKHQIPIENEAGLFFTQAKGRFIGITGTKGKSTVATLVYKILKKHNSKTLLAGNIRTTAMLDIIDRVKRTTPVVLELSSWQLEGLVRHHLSPGVALITNVFPDHLNRYNSYQAYQQAKAIIFRYQKKSDLLVLNFDNPVTRRFGQQAKIRLIWFSLRRLKKQQEGAFLDQGKIWLQQKERARTVFALEDIRLIGQHNLENVLAAVALTASLGVPGQTIKSVVRRFRGIAGRLEFIRTVRGVRYLNDTTATAPVAATIALKALAKSGKIILIAGGQDKELTFREFAREIDRRVKTLVLLPGTASVKLRRLIRRTPIKPVKNMTEAVKVAARLARGSKTVLLSPGAASFNLFKNEFDRGEQFIKAVKDL